MKRYKIIILCFLVAVAYWYLRSAILLDFVAFAQMKYCFTFTNFINRASRETCTKLFISYLTLSCLCVAMPCHSSEVSRAGLFVLPIFGQG